jgi:PAS domain S-box-containing protein
MRNISHCLRHEPPVQRGVVAKRASNAGEEIVPLRPDELNMLSSQQDSRWETPRLISAVAGSYALTGGLITLIGWTANLQPLTDWVNNGISMMPNMAVALVLAGAALVLLSFGYPGAATVLGLFTGLIGAATLFEHVTAINLGIDTLLVSQPWGQRGAFVPGRIGPPGSASLTIIGAAIILAAFGRQNRRWTAAGGVLVIGIAMLSITGYIFGADALFALPRFTAIALQTATILLALGLGLVMSVPEVQPMRMLRGHSAATVLVRRALPFIILLPIVVGWLRLQGQNAGWYDAAFGTALRTVAEVALLVGLLWWAAKAVTAHEKPLRESETRKAAILNSSLDAIVSMDAHGHIVEFNPAAERMFGQRAIDVIGRPLSEIIIPERLRVAHEQGLARYHATGEGPVLGKRIEMPALRADGTEFPVELSINRVPGLDPPLFSGFIRDISARNRAQVQLREAHELLANRAKQLEKLVEERTADLRNINETLVLSLTRQDKLTDDLRETVQQLETFSYSVVHDMRAPLRSMRSFAAVLEAEYDDKLDDTGRSYLQRIIRSAIRMDALITDVLAYSRIASSETPLAPVNLDKLVTDIVENYPQFQEAAEAIQIQHPLPAVHGNPALLTQIISNLLGNALKFVAPGRAARVTVRGENGAGKVRLWFEDNGIGIAREHQGKIFDLFKRLHRLDEYPGTGVGLAVVKKAVERMGGKVSVESEPGVGSRFSVELDVAPGGNAKA